jgi:hypothetical protein
MKGWMTRVAREQGEVRVSHTLCLWRQLLDGALNLECRIQLAANSIRGWSMGYKCYHFLFPSK